jgi:alkaline phosphatase D
LIQSANPHIKFVDLEDHGLFIADFNKQRTQADFIFTQTINEPDNINVSCPVAFYVNAGERFVRQASGCVSQKKKYPPLAPPTAPLVSVKPAWNGITAFNVWPNPTPATMVVQYSLARAQEVTLRIVNSQGITIYESRLGTQQPGLRYAHFDASTLSPGYYYVYLEGEGGRKGCAVLKI